MVESFIPTVARAEDSDESGEIEGSEESGEQSTPDESEEERPAEEEQAGKEEEEEEEEEEAEDILPGLREKAAEGPCHSFKHHFEECVERVTAAQQEPGYEDREYKEDCVEEL